MNPTEPAVVAQRAHDWTLWVIPKAEKFPRSYRFTLGDRMVKSSMELLLNLVNATPQRRNVDSLEAASREINRIRYLVRQDRDLRVIAIDNHESVRWQWTRPAAWRTRSVFSKAKRSEQTQHPKDELEANTSGSRP